MVKNQPANAGDSGWTWSGKIPRAMEQLSPCAATTEPALSSPGATTTEHLEPVLRNTRRRLHEKPLRQHGSASPTLHN